MASVHRPDRKVGAVGRSVETVRAMETSQARSHERMTSMRTRAVRLSDFESRDASFLISNVAAGQRVVGRYFVTSVHAPRMATDEETTTSPATNGDHLSRRWLKRERSLVPCISDYADSARIRSR
jgi:hypothetical protein